MVPQRFQTILTRTAAITAAFKADGFSLELVGGAIRDTFLDEQSSTVVKDYDFATNADVATIERILKSLKPNGLWTIGAKFGTIGAIFNFPVEGSDAPDEVVFEITTYRGDSEKPTLAQDLAARDFTVNAIAFDLINVEILDPTGGIGHLSAKVLACPCDPNVTFESDPLRMMRAARFIAGFGLTPSPDIEVAIAKHAPKLASVSVERVRDELDKLLVVPDPSDGLWFLCNTGLSDVFLPELNAMRLEQDPIHQHKDVLAHTIAVVARSERERIVRLAALLHDIAKPKTRSIGPDGVSFHMHDIKGARMTKTRMKVLRYSNDDVDSVSKLVALHLRFHTYSMGWTDSAVRRYVTDAGDLLHELNALTRADCTTRNVRKAQMLSKRMDDLEDRIAALRQQEELDAIRPDLDGNAIMELLGVGAGRIVGGALKMLLAARIEEGPLERAEAERRVLEWYAANN